MAIYDGMVGIAELVTNDEFLSWVESQDDAILEKPTREVWSLFQNGRNPLDKK